MHISDGLRAYGIERKAVIVIVLLPFLVLSLICIGASPENDLTSPAHASLDNSVLTTGVFRYLNVTLPTEHEKICILAFNGNTQPDPQDCSEKNYYRWEYDHGIWKDVSGYDTSYIESSQCSKNNTTYSFYLRISQKATPGSWTIKIFVDTIETQSYSCQVIIADFCLFFSGIIGVFEPTIKHKGPLPEEEIYCCNTQKKQESTEASVERLVDNALQRHAKASHDDTLKKKIKVISDVFSDSTDTQEPIRAAKSLYPRTKLKHLSQDATHKIFYNKSGRGGMGFWTHASEGMKRVSLLFILVLLFTAPFAPFAVMMGNNKNPCVITIINNHSYPVIGGNWTVHFTVVGCDDLTISAVNGTRWVNTDSNADLTFLSCTNGSKTVECFWINNSVFIPNFSSNVICSEISKVLTPGVHTLKFQFGDDIVFAYNLASENWLQTSTSDFNNGTKMNVNVNSGSFHLQERYLLRNFTRIYNEGFEGGWLPTSWSEVPSTSNWNAENYEVYEGRYSADFDGIGGPGGASGNLLSPIMNCSGSNVTAIYVKFWGFEDAADDGEYYLDYYDGSAWDQIRRLDNFGSDVWAQYSQKITDSQYFKSNFQIRWRVVGLNNNEHVYVDLVNVTVERNESGYYSTGNLLSQAHDTTRIVPDYNNLVVTNSTPSGTTVTKWMRSAATQANLTSATWYTDLSQLPDLRWVQWRINLTGDTYLTPTVTEVNLTWTYDDENPVSSVNSFYPYWQTTQQFQVFVTASDNGTGVEEVALYYNYSANNATGWLGWTLYGTNDTTSPYNWSFTSPQGDGYYRFYSKAKDGELNFEDSPSSPNYDAFCGVDTAKPSSRLDNITPYWYDEPVITVKINCSTANDSLSGLSSIILYYRYRRDNLSAWGSWRSFASDGNTPWSWIFNFPKAKGFYQFYSIAVDRAGNTEDPPISPDNDTECAFNSTKPYSEVDVISPYWTNSSLTITAQATDFNGSGLSNVTLFYYYSTDNNSWSSANLYGVDTDPWVSVSWFFTFLNGSGYYRFYSRAVDNVSSVEYYTGNDTWCGYDSIPPSSQVDSITPYWHNLTNNPLLVTVTNINDTLSGIQNVTLYYRFKSDNLSSWNEWTFFGTDENTPWSWNFNFPMGDGHYQFYSRAYDLVENLEDEPSSPEFDAQGGYDTSKPVSQIDSITPYNVTISPLLITATASDDVNSVTIWYYFNSQNSSWWNPSWSYRKLLTISGKNGGYHMKLIVGNTTGGNVTCNGHAESDFGDIRFVSYSDNSTLLSYWRKNYTANTQATFWINNSLNDTYIWMYYGNDTASTTSNGANTFYFFDDFSNGLSKWTMNSWNTDAIYISSNQGNSAPALRHDPDTSIPANRTYFDTRIRTSSYRMQDGTLEYDVYLAGIPRIIYQFGWRVNALSWTNGYAWRLQNANSDGGFFEFSGATTWTAIGTSFPDATVNTWYHVKVDVSGSSYVANVNPACGGATTRSATDSTKLTSDYLVSHVHGVTMNSTNFVLVDNVFVRKYRATPPTWSSFSSEETGYIEWNNVSNPDTSLPWSWSFNFSNGYGFYWFFSLATDINGNQENKPSTFDARCRYSLHTAPVINNYDLRNGSGSKLNNATGLLDVNSEYYFTVNITTKYSWSYIDDIEIKAWYDNGNENSAYNQTAGGNLNMHLRYENITGIANYSLLWPHDEVQLIRGNCSETVINTTTRIITISFRPLNQTRWASSNSTWNNQKNSTNDPFSWNFNVSVIDISNLKSWVKDEYGIYKYANIIPEQNWVNVEAPPGYYATTNVVNITYSSNYDFNISIYFEENLTNSSSGEIIPIANNVNICADADSTDDITTDIMFNGIGEINSIDIINTSGIFHKNNTSQIVQVQFDVYIPFGTIRGEYSAHVSTKIKQKEE